MPQPTISGQDVDSDRNPHGELRDSSPKSHPARSARSSASPLSAGDTLAHRYDTLPKHIPPEFIISPERRQAILGTAPNAPRPSSNPAVRHTMHFVIRALLSWPRLMSIHPPTRLLPPPIHKLQIVNDVPPALANCYALTKMWVEHTTATSGLVRKIVLDEIGRLLREHSNSTPSDLLAESQSLLILLIILLFGLSPTASRPLPDEAPLLIRAWDLKHTLSATGLSLPEEDPNTTSRTTPSWDSWVNVTAKRRTIHAFHHVEWAWSVLHGYPVLTCFELGPLPAPPAGYLWREENREVWEAAYAEWAERWTKEKGGLFRMGDFFEIEPGKDLDRRGQMWLAEADEYGMMVMAEGEWCLILREYWESKALVD